MFKARTRGGGLRHAAPAVIGGCAECSGRDAHRDRSNHCFDGYLDEVRAEKALGRSRLAAAAAYMSANADDWGIRADETMIRQATTAAPSMNTAKETRVA